MKARSALPVLLMVVVLCVMIYLALTKQTDVVKDSNDTEYDVVMALDFAESYPETPDKVLQAYHKINTFLSGNTNRDFTEEDLTALLEKQRMLLDLELLSINPFDSHLAEYKEKMKYLEEEGVRIIQVNVESPIFSEDAKKCSIACLQLWSKNIAISIVYNMRKENETGKWKIVGWFVNSGQP